MATNRRDFDEISEEVVDRLFADGYFDDIPISDLVLALMNVADSLIIDYERLTGDGKKAKEFRESCARTIEVSGRFH